MCCFGANEISPSEHSPTGILKGLLQAAATCFISTIRRTAWKSPARSSYRYTPDPTTPDAQLPRPWLGVWCAPMPLTSARRSSTPAGGCGSTPTTASSLPQRVLLIRTQFTWLADGGVTDGGRRWSGTTEWPHGSGSDGSARTHNDPTVQRLITRSVGQSRQRGTGAEIPDPRWTRANRGSAQRQ